MTHSHAETSGTQLAEGDRVVIADRNHPHWGRAGVLRPTATVFFPWRVVFDEGDSGCVDEHEVRKV
jgi:hypothetical protein